MSYTPTTEEVLKAAISDYGGSAIRPAEFNRWLFEVKQDAWDEGYRVGASEGWDKGYHAGNSD